MATIEIKSSGKHEIRDSSNHLLGTYDPRTNDTRDASNRMVAKGNVLTSLISPFS
ncbi:MULTISPECIES: hypothetical protein [unclassified Brevundimonas]|uniref:hypothetical protein n=1 Tax=unclassified Brevundimonas TaxID=2622653 RepID=UPI00191075D8|nr:MULTISPECIES: hypothetical protein [unclassified Brevundimonas]